MSTMSRHAETDLLPWIFGGILLAAGCIAAVVTIYHPVNLAKPIPAMTPIAALAPPIASEVLPHLVRQTSLPIWQVYQCTFEGKPTFSDFPCGDNAVVRQLSAVNTMEPEKAPTIPTRTYESPSHAEYQTFSNESVDPAEQSRTDVYVSEYIEVIEERRKWERRHRDHHHAAVRRRRD